MMGEALKGRNLLVQAATAFSRRIGEPGHKPWLVYGGDEHQERSDLEVIGWRGFGARLLGRQLPHRVPRP
jgi:hypothetical protein